MFLHELVFDISDSGISNGRIVEGYTDKDGYHLLAVMDVTRRNFATEIAFTEKELEEMLHKLKKGKEI